MDNSKSARFGNIKEKNLKTLFCNIADNEGVSRAQLAREAGLSKPAVSALVDELISLGFVRMGEASQLDHAGRKPISLELNADYGVFFTVALNKSFAEYKLYDFSLKALEGFSFDISYEKGCIKKLISDIFKKSSLLENKKIICSCFVLPAATDSKLSDIRSTVLEFCEGFDLISEINEVRNGGAKVIVNETIAYVYAEKCYEKTDEENIIFVEVDEGVGAGIIIENKVFRGVSGSAGEFGHMSVDRNGEECYCGRRGCLELSVSKNAILRKAAAMGISGGIQKDYSEIVKAYALGSSEAKNLYEHISSDLSFGIGNMIAMFDISCIVIGGGIEQLGEPLLDMLRKKTDKLLISGEYRTKHKLDINYTNLNSDAKNLGAVKYFCDKLLTITESNGEELFFV